MTAAPSVAPMGERALLVRLPDLDAVLAWYADLERAPLDGQVDLVPGAESLLIHFAGPATRLHLARLRERAIALAHHRPVDAGEDRHVTLDVVYDGADLDQVGTLTGLGADGVIAAHTGAPWRVAFCGFAPGFGYLAGGDPRLSVPRRDSPRAEVPAGAVGLAGDYSGVYPRRSPGGWQLIGRTEAVLWDPRREQPALLRPGTTVRFRPRRPAVTVSSGAAESMAPAQTGDTPDRRPALVVVKPGMQCTVQDLGRVGHAAIGVSPSGVADRGAAARANRLLGNPLDAAVLEILNGGAELEALADLTVAVTGAPAALTVHGATAAEALAKPGTDCAIALSAGERLKIGRPRVGLRAYLAVRGGIQVAPVLGSRSTDTLAGLGPGQVRAGDVLPVGLDAGGGPRRAKDPPPECIESDEAVLAILPGPQRDWLTDEAVARLLGEAWVASPASDRVGVRLTGPALDRSRPGEAPSQGLVRGAVQLTPAGELVVFLADYPVTGGYPVVAVLTDAATDRAAQLRPGARARLVVAPSNEDDVVFGQAVH